jgi:hypothetical protein
MIFKLPLAAFLKELEQINSLVNGKKSKNGYQLISLSTLGPDCLVLWFGDVQNFIPAQVLDSGGWVADIKLIIGVLKTFKGPDVSVWVQDSNVTIKVGDRKLQINTASSVASITAFQEEQGLNTKKLKKAEAKLFAEFMKELRFAQQVSYVDDGGVMQTGGIFLGLLSVDGRIMAQVANYDRKVQLIDPKRIGRAFKRPMENPLARQML